MSIRMIGGPTAVLEIGGLRLVTDPTFDEPRDYPLGAGHALSKTAGPASRPAEIGRVDAVLLSHDQHPRTSTWPGGTTSARCRWC